ncbi:hypothetical protein [Streptomyces canus]|uniref:hypothetical protein n=1 Tax=Streptomyces canus TaxID=58343 RepID=UPI00278A56B4|nr:hypothetical protein [Streptomyces canus]MDQ0761803.1 hypothetical protein [Streptomyces canus]MDQ1069616.1 hypothetical protein [Streptomyces canus]
MSRRTNSSCLGIAVKVYLQLNLWVLVGYALALPATVPDLMAAQKPPQEVHGLDQYAVLYGIPVVAATAVTAFTCRTRPCPPWVFLARTAAVVALSQAAVAWAGARFDSPDWSSRSLAQSGAAGLAALLCHRAARWWEDGGLNGGRRRPAAGEIWHALVPFRASDGELPHYCVVMRPRLRHVEVLQITSQNKDDRADHIRIPNDGWDFTSGKAHWVEIGLLPRRVPYEKFTGARPKGRCPKPTWKQLRDRRPAPMPSGSPSVWSRITQRLG